ncbi:6-phospho-3-hexuloisomerase [Hymenobacter sp. UV11]|uniref:6-phospho-3-hexuloisomerase n=1 Tax=Hymenobacter sp. UV11 TaxID=1849735 RepID=UPI00105F8582|nr:6-phospho-3-hexuloisomerase [Hymenobacter sp. UV11]TDN40327.1 6-phospho 3-hexuloisomerase [Hymenobacter sp. UV11]TFZ66673.1 6-phospho-3-hexuloisomerase [Hymenobacter sp. UV11]
MRTPENHELAADLQRNLQLIMQENDHLTQQLNFEQLAAVVPLLQQAERVFVAGAGRTGLALKAAAMRLMHLGLTVFVMGETTTPAIRKGDLLLVGSGSGTTSTIVKAAEKAQAAGAKVVAISTTTDSPLAALATLVVVVPAAQKQDHGGSLSQQYAGSLFEQSVLLLTDALFQTLWALDGTPAEELWKRHANLE